jgi:hypothetical protein
LAVLQYTYTLFLLSLLQQEPQILSRLMELSTTLDTHHLPDLAKHAMHLSISTSRPFVAGPAARAFRDGACFLQFRSVFCSLTS